MILVVDDHNDTRIALVRLMQSEGIEAVGVATGLQALVFLETNIPELIILDGMMPGIDGLDVLGMIRGNPRLRDIPVIFYSADASPNRMALATAAGANEFIVKGTGWADVLGRIRKLATPVQPAQHAQQSRPIVPPPPVA